MPRDTVSRTANVGTLGINGECLLTPQRVVELPGLGQFTISSNGGVDAPQVRECGSEGKAVQHLGTGDIGIQIIIISQSLEPSNGKYLLLGCANIKIV